MTLQGGGKIARELVGNGRESLMSGGEERHLFVDLISSENNRSDSSNKVDIIEQWSSV